MNVKRQIMLTAGQRADLNDLFHRVRTINASAGSVGNCAIVAQVFEDGMVVKLLDKAEAAALRRALGGDPTKIVHTSDEHMKVSSAKGGAA